MSVQDDRKAQKALTDHRRNVARRRLKVLQDVMGTVEGREFIYDLIDNRCGMFGSSFTGDSKTFLREGMRKIAIDLTKDIQENCTELYVAMISEAFNLKQRERLVEESAQAIAQRNGESNGDRNDDDPRDGHHPGGHAGAGED